MESKENQTVMSGRDKLLSRMSSKYPDKRFAPSNGVDGVNDVDDLDEAIAMELEEQDNLINTNREKNESLVNLLMSDPQAAQFINEWVTTGDPRAALVRTFGDELSALATEEGRSKFGSDLMDWRARKEENDRLNNEADENWYKVLENLNSWGERRGLDMDGKKDVGVGLLSIYQKGLTNSFDESDFEMMYKAANYDKDVERARREGEVAGRNQKITAERRDRSVASNMPPATGSGRGIKATPPKTKPYNPWDEI